jgi:hypothetical protein
MITVTVEKKGRDYIRFKSKGHAGSNFEDWAGRDIVCAAVSALIINTVNSLEAFTTDKAEVKEDDGWLQMTFAAPLSEKGILLMDSLILGLTETENGDGKHYLKVRIREV